jgi:23S rRNA (uracil1939-C5)-methyltransferase
MGRRTVAESRLSCRTMSRSSAPPVRKRDVVEVTIERLAQGGRGVARLENFVLFVTRALPGDRVKARVTKVKRSYAEANAIELLEPGADNVTPPCPYVGTCGGCQWQRLDYLAQLGHKQDQVREAIERLGGVEAPNLQPIVAADDPFGYRNKVEYTFTPVHDEEEGEFPQLGEGTSGADEPDPGDEDHEPVREDEVFPPVTAPTYSRVALGFHMAGRWDRVVAVEPCLIADPRGLPAKRIVEEWANQHGLLVYDRDQMRGLLRSLVVRVGRNTGEVMVNIVTGPCKSGKLPKGAELVDDLQAGVPGLVSVLHSETDSSAEVSVGDGPPQLLWGREWFEETLAGKRLRVRSGSFLQTNTAMSEKLYDLILEVAEPRADEVAYDLYCGIGSITLALAPHVDAVVGVEVVQEAIDCAKENAELNGITNVDFQVGNVRPVLKFSKGVWPDPSLVVVDPPRSGLSPKVVKRICELQPERIVYVSCNPATFAGNLPQFREHGFELTYVRPVDQFPHTPHVELVARLDPIPGWEPPAEE